MKLFLLSIIISLAWLAMQGKTIADRYLKLSPGQKQLQADKPMPKKVISRLSDTDKEKLKELGIDENAMQYEVVSPALMLKEQGNESISRILEQRKRLKTLVLKSINDVIKNARYYLLILAGLILSFRIIQAWPLLKILSGFHFGLSRLALFLASIGAVVYAHYFKANLWDRHILFWFPSAMLCISAAGLKFSDMNFPVWRSIYKSFILPAVSGIIIFFMLH